jgi:hypothetical protein
LCRGFESLAAHVTFDKYTEIVAWTDSSRPDWRLGQTYFNVLHQVRPHLAEQVRATDLDPFHTDDRIPAFLAFVESNW